MIRTFKNKALRELWETGKTAGINKQFHDRCRRALDVIHSSRETKAMDVGGLIPHPLHQFKPVRWAVWVSGAWRITFEFDKGDAYRVDFEQYHGKK